MIFRVGRGVFVFFAVRSGPDLGLKWAIFEEIGLYFDLEADGVFL